MNKEELAMHIHTVRGLISYHERLTLCRVQDKHGSEVLTTADAFKDIYLGALRCGLCLMEREYGRMVMEENERKNAVRCDG